MDGQEEVLPPKPRIITNPSLSDTFKQNSMYLYGYKIIAKCGKGPEELQIYI